MKKLYFFTLRTAFYFAVIALTSVLPAKGFCKSFNPKTLQKGGHLKNFQEKSYRIKGNRRAGREFIPIDIQIANLKRHHLSLEEKNLKNIFGLANKYTCNVEYPCYKNSKKINGRLVHRPNHNGTHSARQVRYLEALFDLVEKRGSPMAKTVLQGLSKQEVLNLKLGAYFLRAGRVDESSHKNPPADDYYTRSALIYEQYAKQLGVDKKTINWVKTLIVNSCKPKGVRDPSIDKDPKNRFGYEAFTFVHEMDLIRCFSFQKIESSTKPAMRKRLDYFVHNKYSIKRDKYMSQWMRFAKDVCSATGVYRQYDSRKGDRWLFAICSTEGRTCWNKVKSVNAPRW